jgi:hypothetical protein
MRGGEVQPVRVNNLAFFVPESGMSGADTTIPAGAAPRATPAPRLGTPIFLGGT